MSVIFALRRLAEHEERIARLELANAERQRVAQEQVVARTTNALQGALAYGAGSRGDPLDHYHRHGYALRLEMARRGAERRLLEHHKDVSHKRDAIASAARQRGTLDRLVELHEAEVTSQQQRAEQKRLDETGLQGWWRRV